MHALGPLVLPTTRDRQLSGTLPPQGLDLTDGWVGGLGLSLTSYIVFVARVPWPLQLRSLMAFGEGEEEHIEETDREIFISEDYDDNPVRSVEGKCFVQHDKEIGKCPPHPHL